MTSRKDDAKFPPHSEGSPPATTMSWTRFEEINDIEATGQPLKLSPQEFEEYEQAKATFQATLQPAMDKAMAPVKAQMRNALRKIQTPELDELLKSLRSKQSELNSLVASASKEGPKQDLAEITGMKEEDPLDVLRSLTETQTKTIDELATVIKNSGTSQRNFNLLMLFVAVLAAIFAAGQLIAAVNG